MKDKRATIEEFKAGLVKEGPEVGTYIEVSRVDITNKYAASDDLGTYKIPRGTSKVIVSIDSINHKGVTLDSQSVEVQFIKPITNKGD